MYNLASYLMCKESLINSNSVHLGPKTGLPDKILKGDHQRIIFAKLESNWPSSLRGKKIKFHPPFLFLATVAILVGCLGCRTQFWKMVIKGLSKVSSNWPSSFRDEDILNFIPFFIFSNNDHVGWRSGLPDTILEGDHPRTIPPKFGLKWPSGFRGEYF
jgi:hypothetical protein